MDDGVVGLFFFTGAALTTTGSVGGELPVVEEEEEGLDMGCFLIDADPPAPMGFEEEGGVVIGFFTGVVAVASFTGVIGVLEGNFLESGLTGVVCFFFFFADSLSTICIGDMVSKDRKNPK